MSRREGDTSRILRHVHRDARAIVRRMQRLQEVGVALTSEHDLGRLLDLVLRESRGLTQADAGSIFLRHDEIRISPHATAKDEIQQITPFLDLKLAQNDSIRFPFREMRLPFDDKTVAGHVALSGAILNLRDAYRLPEGARYSYSSTFDQISGYRCRSMLVLPMRNREGEIIGVLQLINKKKTPAARLDSDASVEREVVPFDEFDEEFLTALASQAAVAVENAKLYDDIEGMFGALVDSFSLAIEKRDAATFGHCTRVAQYAVAIAEAVNSTPEADFDGCRFTRAQLRELRYAALLHDVGKIAVPEAILGKRNKLTDAGVRSIEYRLAYWRATRRDPEVDRRMGEYAARVREINVPLRFTPDDLALLDRMRSEKFVDVDGAEKPLLTDHEYENLRVERGNLTPAERRTIERHIVDTWELLKRIPWPKGLRRLPNIASCHHEKVNGDGYPWGLSGEEIPLGGRILALVDIYEALTAKDRSYKPAFPIAKALEILEAEVAAGHIDARLFRIFKEREIYRMFMDERGYVSIKVEE